VHILGEGILLGDLVSDDLLVLTVVFLDFCDEVEVRVEAGLA
jgi:hypothetical protein